MSNMGRGRLVQCLDTAVVGYILAVYTMDETIFRAILAYMFHHEISKPFRQDNRVLQNIATRNALVCISVNQLVAIFMHILGDKPQPGVDGYLHGSAITSFIGVLPPSRLRLVAGDIIILVLEFLVFITARDPEYTPGPPINVLEPGEGVQSISRRGDIDEIVPKRAFAAAMETIPPQGIPTSREGAPSDQEEDSDSAQPPPDNVVAYLRAMSGVSW